MQTRPRPVKYRRKNKKRFVHKVKPVELPLRPYQVVLGLLVTEKGTHLSNRHNAYSFHVNLLATKTQIKKAIEELFNVRVEAVRTSVRHGKIRRTRQKFGQMPDWKKAVVKLHSEDKIDFM